VDAALSYLEEHQVMTLATQGAGGVWAAAVFYTNVQFDLYFLSAEHTRHVQNIRQNPRVAATIQEDYRDWKDIKGVQLEGIVQQLTGEAREEAIARYGRKFPFVANADARMQAALDQVEWFRLRPDRFYFVDNSRGFGHRDRIL
jgi:uncharacterized protein YhbP (UPF0306 family)